MRLEQRDTKGVESGGKSGGWHFVEAKGFCLYRSLSAFACFSDGHFGLRGSYDKIPNFQVEKI